MKPLRIAYTCLCLFLIGCGESERSAPASEAGDVAPSQMAVQSKRVYRCEWSPLIDPSAKDITEALQYQNWRVEADGVSNDAEVYARLAKVIAGLPGYTGQDYPFAGFYEHYLLTDGSAKGILIGFVCEDHGIVVWEMAADDNGRWMKTDSGTLRGTEEDKTAIRLVLSKIKFDSL